METHLIRITFLRTLLKIRVTFEMENAPIDDIQTRNGGERTEQSQDGSRDFWRRRLRVYNVCVCVCVESVLVGKGWVGGGVEERGGSDRWFLVSVAMSGQRVTEQQRETRWMDGEKEGRERLFLSPL
ncbi:unnamed protein product [Boreogadus saida]